MVLGPEQYPLDDLMHALHLERLPDLLGAQFPVRNHDRPCCERC